MKTKSSEYFFLPKLDTYAKHFGKRSPAFFLSVAINYTVHFAQNTGELMLRLYVLDESFQRESSGIAHLDQSTCRSEKWLSGPSYPFSAC